MRFTFVEVHSKRVPVKRLCRMLKVSSRGFRAWRERPVCQRQRDDMVLLAHIREQHQLSLGSYGRPRITQELKELGLCVGHRRVGRLMRDNRIYVARTHKYKATTDSHHRFNVAPNVLDRNFAAALPNQKWAGDISNIWTAEGWLYLAVMIDLHSRRVIGWAVSNRLKRDLALQALDRAVALRNPPPGCIHHTDRGSQHCSHDYQKRLWVFEQQRATFIVGVPQLKRYTFAGHLFAGYQGKIYRIDRHPVMSLHPVTPMRESDVLLHLALQTSTQVDLIDVYDSATQTLAGEALLKLPPPSLPFTVSSSGVEYALMAGLKRKRTAQFAPVPAVDQMLVISGSVSPTTERQIAYAKAHGFETIAADALSLARDEVEPTLRAARSFIANGKSPLIYSASGSASDQGAALRAIPNGREILSKSLGKIARALVQEFKLKRLVIAGGDTSSHALSELDVYALTTRFPLIETPGSPLCLAHSKNVAFNGLEIALKGAQVGGDDYFVKLKEGIA